MLSSDEEDDQDEEELLQRALAEQAQRQVRYNRPPNQQPPAVSPAAAGPPSRKPPAAPSQKQTQKPAPMEDDESEEELLSISSDDDAAPAPTRKPAGTRKEPDLGIEEFSDEEEVEEEPTTWRKVDEEELTRKVRDMREARAAPGGRFRTGVTIARRSTMVGETYPREDLIDPLGLGTIDIKSLSLISDSSSPASAAVKNAFQEVPSPGAAIVRDHGMREKVMYHSEKFDPKFFLARIHQNTKAADLEDGDAALKVDLQNRKQQLKLLVKENFDCFVSCKNTIDDIHSKLQQIEADPEGAGTIHLTNAIQDVDEVARRAFGPLLERQAQAERIRSVQGMLQRFRTLFNLPSAIRANISKGEYDMAVREYKKTKSLVLPSHGRILKRVFEEVEKVVQELKEMLSRCMEDPHAEFSQLENAIRLLLELEPDSDPVWQYLNIQERRIRGMLEGCIIEHEGQMDSLHARVQQKIQSDARWKQLQSESHIASEVDMFLFIGNQEQDATEASIKQSISAESDALLGRLIRRLSTVLIRYVPDFWRLALSIFNGKFAKVSHPGSRKDETDESDHENYPFEEKQVGIVQYTSHSLDEVVAMVQGIIASYEAKAHTAFLALAEATVMRGYMRDALGEISKACAALEGKDCAPLSAVQAITTLKMELMHVFTSKFCALMREKASELVEEEDWVPVPAVERSGSPFAISSLPLRLQEMLTSTFEHMKKMLEKVKNDTTGPEDLSHLTQMQNSLQTAFFECFLDITELLDKRVIELSQTVGQDPNEASEGFTKDDKFVGLQMGLEVINPHQRLLMVLSNVGYIKDVLLPELSRKHRQIHERSNSTGKGSSLEDVRSSPTSEAEVLESLSALEEKILNQYNYAKATSVGTAAAAYILDDGTQWASAPPVKGIRDAVVELIHPLVAVHAEVYAGAKPFVRKVICVLFEGLMDALLNTLSGNKSKALKHLDVNGYCQLMLELDYVESALKLYCTKAARASLTSLRTLLLERVLEVSGDLTENIGHNRRPTRGSEDDDNLQAPLTAEEIQARAQQVKVQYLPSELKRTRINVICFLEGPDSISNPEAGKRTGSFLMNSSAGVLQAHKTEGGGQQHNGRHRRRSSGSSFSDEPGKPFAGLPPLSPFHPSGYGSSSDSGSSDLRRAPADRYLRQTDPRRAPQRSSSAFDDDLR